MSAHVPDWLELPLAALQATARAAGVELRPHLQRDELCAALATQLLQNGEEVTTEGALALLPEGFGFVRLAGADYAPTAVDAFVSPSQARALNLKTGHRVRGPLRAPHGNERFFALTHVTAVQGAPADRLGEVAAVDARAVAEPTVALALPLDDDAPAIARPLAGLLRGQRALLLTTADAPPARAFAALAQLLRAGDPALTATVCLLDQRPEEAAAARALAGAGVTVLATPFAADPERHAQLAELALAAAQRDVERGRDHVLLLDSLTALTRAVARSQPASGRWASPGLDAAALMPAKRLFAAARELDGQGSLTVVASALRGDEPGFERAVADEFRPLANRVAPLA